MCSWLTRFPCPPLSRLPGGAPRTSKKATGLFAPLLPLVCLCLPGIASALSPGDFVVRADESQLVSLDANAASLQAIIAELSMQTGVEVTGELSEDVAVTASFDGLPLSAALREIGENYMLLEEPEDGKVARIILLGKGDGTRYIPPSQPTAAPQSGEAEAGGSFRFEFDPEAAPAAGEDGEDPADAAEAQMLEDLKDD